MVVPETFEVDGGNRQQANIVLHVEWVVRVKQCMRAVILTNDTDTFALLLLHVVPYLQIQGLTDIWQEFRLVVTRRKVM